MRMSVINPFLLKKSEFEKHPEKLEEYRKK